MNDTLTEMRVRRMLFERGDRVAVENPASLHRKFLMSRYSRLTEAAQQLLGHDERRIEALWRLLSDEGINMGEASFNDFLQKWSDV